MSLSSRYWMATAFFPSLLDTDSSYRLILWEGSQRLLHSGFTVELISIMVLFINLSPPGVLLPFAVGTICEVVSRLMLANLNEYINSSEHITVVQSGF